MRIFIPNNLLAENVGDYDLLTYSYIKTLAPNNEVKEYYLSSSSISYAIYHDKPGASARDKINKALHTLNRLNYIKLRQFDTYAYIVNNDSLIVDLSLGRFFTIEYQDMKKIMASNYKSKAKLFRYYVYLMSTLNANVKFSIDGKQCGNIVGSQTQSYLSEISGLSLSTIIRYNKILEDLKVIYIHKSEDFLNTSDGLHQLPNVYGRYEHKKYIIEYGEQTKQQWGSYKLLKSKGQAVNASRKLSQKYHWLTRGKGYTETEIKEIYDYVIQHNDDKRKLYKKTNDESLLSQIYDVDIFNHFKFLFDTNGE